MQFLTNWWWESQCPRPSKGEWPAGIGQGFISPSWKLTSSRTWTTNIIRFLKIAFKETLSFSRKGLSFCLQKGAHNSLCGWVPVTQILFQKLNGKWGQGYNSGFVGGRGVSLMRSRLLLSFSALARWPPTVTKIWGWGAASLSQLIWPPSPRTWAPRGAGSCMLALPGRTWHHCALGQSEGPGVGDRRCEGAAPARREATVSPCRWWWTLSSLLLWGCNLEASEKFWLRSPNCSHERLRLRTENQVEFTLLP